MNTTSIVETIHISEIDTKGRIRSDLGDIDQLCNSIKEFGLIQPIVLVRETVFDHPNYPMESFNKIVLVAGGRRLTAMKRIAMSHLRHGKEYVWRDEVLNGDPAIRMKLQAIEIEENVRRKDLSWQEIVLGKERLLAIMQQIHGVANVGGRTREEKRTGESVGFGVRKLASMLGESPATVSQDLQLAKIITQVPSLRHAETKESARRQVSVLTNVHAMVQAGKVAANVQAVNNQAAIAAGQPVQAKLWELYEGEFAENSPKIASGSVDLVYTDLPFGVELDKMSKHGGNSVVNYSDSRKKLLSDLDIFSSEAFRLLANDRFAVFWFGFNYYGELLTSLGRAGFTYSPVPFIWFKNTRSTENPNTRYGNSYDPAIIAMKGSPVFIRPGQQNYAAINPIPNNERLQIAQQPIELVNRFLVDMTVPGALVADFTAGSGTTGVAAVRAKRRVVLFEKEAPACMVIKARLGAEK